MWRKIEFPVDYCDLIDWNGHLLFLVDDFSR